MKQGATRRLFMFASVDWLYLVISLLGALLFAGCDVAFNALFGHVIKAVLGGIEEHSNTELVRTSILMLLTSIGIGVGLLLQTGFVEMAGTRVVSRIQRLTFGCMIRQDADFFDEYKVGELTTVLTANTELVRGGLTSQLASAVKGLVTFVGVLIYLMVLDWKLTLVFFGAALVPLASLAVNMVWVGRLTKRKTEAQGVQGAIANEMLSGSRTVISFSIEYKAQLKYNLATAATNRLGVTTDWVNGGTWGFLMAGFYSTLVLSLYYGGMEAIRGPGGIDVALVISFVNLAILMISGLGTLMGAGPEVAKVTIECLRDQPCPLPSLSAPLLPLSPFVRCPPIACLAVGLLTAIIHGCSSSVLMKISTS